MLHTIEPAELSQWLTQAFRDKVPPSIVELKTRRDDAENNLRQMELSPEGRQVADSFLALHEADTLLLYGVVETLFKRHLKGHRARR
ncbi:MAG: hypothetical protein HY319_26855 [Armatimonadetes bacterium]|nr:hypothetical protein [Armatimonadota bacterium]